MSSLRRGRLKAPALSSLSNGADLSYGQCYVCKGELRKEVIHLRKCRHLFHEKCLREWRTQMSTGAVCPRCWTECASRTPNHATEPARVTTPVQATEPARVTTPVQATESARVTTPVQATESARVTTPVQATESARVTTPHQANDVDRRRRFLAWLNLVVVLLRISACVETTCMEEDDSVWLEEISREIRKGAAEAVEKAWTDFGNRREEDAQSSGGACQSQATKSARMPSIGAETIDKRKRFVAFLREDEYIGKEFTSEVKTVLIEGDGALWLEKITSEISEDMTEPSKRIWMRGACLRRATEAARVTSPLRVEAIDRRQWYLAFLEEVGVSSEEVPARLTTTLTEADDEIWLRELVNEAGKANSDGSVQVTEPATAVQARDHDRRQRFLNALEKLGASRGYIAWLQETHMEDDDSVWLEKVSSDLRTNLSLCVDHYWLMGLSAEQYWE